MKYAIIIPAYNASKTIQKLISKIQNHIPLNDIFVINDGSKDNTLEILRSEKINVINLKQNQGKGFAIKKSIDYLKSNHFSYNYLIFIDSDLQHNPDEIPKFIDYQKQNNSNLIIGRRSMKLGKMPFQRILSNKIVSFFASLFAHQQIPDAQSGYRLIDFDKLKTIDIQADRFDIEVEMILKFGKKNYKIDSIPIETIYNSDNLSYIKGLREIKNTILLFWRFLFYGK